LPATTTTTAPSLNTDTLTPECLLGYTFCFTGVLTSDVTSREDLIEAVKIMGGRVTTAVSSKTDYLVVGGALLEDGRPSTEGSKYKRAVQEGTVVVQGEHCLYGLCQQYDDKARAAAGLPPRTAIAAAAAVTDQRKAPPVPRTVASDSALAPIAKADNPYARAPNPYAKKAPAPSSNNPYAKKAPPAAAAKPAASTALAAVDATNRLWVDKYKPTSTKDILGNQESVRKLTTWLARWEERFNCPAAVGKAFSNPNGPWKAALLSGPPGIGSKWALLLLTK
jgi:replication factor C subunit 1